MTVSSETSWHNIKSASPLRAQSNIKLTFSLEHSGELKNTTQFVKTPRFSAMENLWGLLWGHLPTELNIFVDASSNHHGNYGIVPRAEEHKRQTQTHTEEWQSPAERERRRERERGITYKSKLNLQAKFQSGPIIYWLNSEGIHCLCDAVTYILVMVYVNTNLIRPW